MGEIGCVLNKILWDLNIGIYIGMNRMRYLVGENYKQGLFEDEMRRTNVMEYSYVLLPQRCEHMYIIIILIDYNN